MSVTQEEGQSLWQYVPIDAYRMPAAPVADTARKGLAGLWHRFRPGVSTPDSPLEGKQDLRALSESRLASVVATPDWSSAAESNDERSQTTKSNNSA
jgi:hypothetical protein